ncbi:hypothetical protein ACPWSR_08340 [Alloiococcus sp. CFN-8]|uniref:hypothetical protein n=1 Tax=Alloiococcus sp. CFN-8 TaxID=3416081 RepID=UPI003CED848C
MKSLLKGCLTLLLIIAAAGLTSCVAKDENNIGDDKNNQNIDLPTEENGYIVKVVPGETAIIDLNGDGEDEIINYTLMSAANDNNGNYTVKNLSISGEEYARASDDNPLIYLGASIYYPDDQWYFIVDIDTSDDYKELAIADIGASEDLTTSYFRYDGEGLEYIGYITGFPADETYSMDGKGTIKSQGRLDLLQYWTTVFAWELSSEGKLATVEEDLYTPISYDYYDKEPVILKEEITAYAEMDLNSKEILMEPSEEEISFPLTDNKNWVLMSKADGTQGWIYIEDRQNIISANKKLPCTDVFDNLYFAD